MTKWKKSILLGILCSIVLCSIGCAHNNSNRRENEVVYDANNSDEKLSDAEYTINDLIYEKSAQWLDENHDKYDNKFVKSTEELIPCKFAMHDIPQSDIPESGIVPLRVIKRDDVLYLHEQEESNAGFRYAIYRCNLKNGEHTLLKNADDNMVIVSMTASSNMLFWLESDCDYSQKDPWWCIWAMDLESGSIQEIDKSDNYGRISMLPRMCASQTKFCYIVGEEKGGVYNHYIRVYDRSENRILFNIANVKTPYMAPYVDDEIVAYPEYFEDGWYALMYHFDTEKVTKTKMPFLTEGEFPQVLFVGDDHICYHSSFNMLYTAKIYSDEFQLIDQGGGVDKCALFDKKFYYLKNGYIWEYDMDTETTCKIWEQDKEHRYRSIYMDCDRVLFFIDDDMGRLSWYMECKKMEG